MRIALFDHMTTSNNPIGSCNLRLLRSECMRHDFTVFAVEFDNPCPDRITWVRVPAPTRPLFLLFIVYHVMAPLMYALHRLRTRSAFDAVQVIESKLVMGDIAYTHFCHRSYLARHWNASRPPGVRGAARWLDHWLHALLEPLTYRRVSRIVVPSHGLAREIAETYPATAEKVSVIVNAVNTKAMVRPKEFDRAAWRAGLGVKPSDHVLVFVALGQFERKGLPQVLKALHAIDRDDLRLVVIGGTPQLIDAYRAIARSLHIADRVTFAGFQRDVKPYYWACDAFIMPSQYEAFSLVALEAAAAGMVTIVPRLHGVEEYATDGVSAIIIEPTDEGTTAGIRRLLDLKPSERTKMGDAAQAQVQQYDEERFMGAWRVFFDGVDGARA